MFCIVVLFFACDKQKEYIGAVYTIKNTSNQTISFDVTIRKGDKVICSGVKNGDVITCTVDANDSIIFTTARTWEDLKNHPNWFTKFEINPVNGIQMNDPYLPENWVKYYSLTSSTHDNSVPEYVFILNKESEKEGE